MFKKVLFGMASIVILSTLAACAQVAARIPVTGSTGTPPTPVIQVIAPTPVTTQQVVPTPIVTEVVEVQPTPELAPTDETSSQACTPAVKLAPDSAGRISYMGISFTMDAALGDSVLVQECPLVPMNESDPWSAHPAYTGFTFPKANEASVFTPELRIYKLDVDTSQFLYPLNSLSDLQAALRDKSEPITWFDGTVLHIRRAYLPFASGAGVRGIVERAQDYYFYNNNYIQYEYDGLTQDGRYYINAHFPVYVPFLLDMRGASTPNDNVNPNAIPVAGWSEDYAANTKLIDAYNQEAMRRFEQMADADFNPSLALLDGLVGSLKIED